MASYITLINNTSRQEKTIKIGWSWSLFLFSPLLIPLIIRDFYLWMAIFFMLSTMNIFLMLMASSALSMPIMYEILWYSISASIILQIFLGAKGNQMTIKHYLKNGWVCEQRQ